MLLCQKRHIYSMIRGNVFAKNRRNSIPFIVMISRQNNKRVVCNCLALSFLIKKNQHLSILKFMNVFDLVKNYNYTLEWLLVEYLHKALYFFVRRLLKNNFKTFVISLRKLHQHLQKEFFVRTSWQSLCLTYLRRYGRTYPNYKKKTI